MSEMIERSLLEYQREQFELERYWAGRIKASSPGSERREAYIHAYAAVSALMEQYKQYFVSLVDKAEFQKVRLLSASSKTKGKFLDIGCARGDLLVQMQLQGWESYGVDVADEGVVEGRQKLRQLGVADAERRIIHGEVADLSEGNFDLIFHSDVLEHIHPDEVPGFLRNCFQKTSVSGQLMLVTPNALIGPSDISRAFIPPGSIAQGLHLKEYTLMELNGLLRNAGYQVIKAYLFHPSSRISFDRVPREIYLHIKLLLETVFSLIPAIYRPGLLKRVFESMDYACVIAQKEK